MLALITLLDGANAQLFHVEHCGNRKWQYQARWPASSAPEYRDWGPVRHATGERALEPLMDPNVICEVRWRWEEEPAAIGDQGSEIGDAEAPPWENYSSSSPIPDPRSPIPSPWITATPHEWGCITCDFHVIVKSPKDFRVDPLIHAAGLVRGFPVAFELTLPSRVVGLSGQEILTLSGTALSPGPAAVLRKPGEFTCTNEHFSVSSAAPSQVTLLPVAPRPPQALPSGPCYAVRLGILPPEEIELLRAYVAEQEAGGLDS